MDALRSLRAQAAAIRAEAEARALALEALALELERGAAVGPAWLRLGDVPLPRTSVRKAIGAGEIRASKVGRELYVSREDVDRFLASKVVTKAVAGAPDELPADRFEAACARARARKAA